MWATESIIRRASTLYNKLKDMDVIVLLDRDHKVMGKYYFFTDLPAHFFYLYLLFVGKSFPFTVYAFRSLKQDTTRDEFMRMYNKLLEKQKKLDEDPEAVGFNIAQTIHPEEVPKMIEDLPHQQKVIKKIREMRSHDGKRDISGVNLEKIVNFIEKGNISHLSMEDVSTLKFLKANLFTATSFIQLV